MEKLNVDCLNHISYEITDKNSLHSCLLINKEWCNIVVPILWKKYSWYGGRKKKIFNVILSCLPSSSRQFLSDNYIKLPSFLLKPPLFNYISFCQFPTTETVSEIVKMVFEEEFNQGNYNKSLLGREIYK